MLSVYRVADYFLTDQATLGQLIGPLATDVVKVGIATGASIAAASLVAGFGFTLAIGPIVAVVVVGVVVSMALGAVDAHYGITDRVIGALDELGEDAGSYIQRSRENIRGVINKAEDSILDYVIVSVRQIIINTARHQLGKFLKIRPRIYWNE